MDKTQLHYVDPYQHHIHRRRRLIVAAAMLVTTLECSTAITLPSTGTKAVATFESLGLYWTPGSNPGSASCQVQ